MAPPTASGFMSYMICRKPESFCFISSPVMVHDGLLDVRERVVRGLLCELQILLHRLLVLLAEGLANDGDGRDGLGTRGEIQLIPCLHNVDGNIQLIDEGLRNLDKRLWQQRHAVRLLLQEVQHLERGWSGRRSSPAQ